MQENQYSFQFVNNKDNVIRNARIMLHFFVSILIFAYWFKGSIENLLLFTKVMAFVALFYGFWISNKYHSAKKHHPYFLSLYIIVFAIGLKQLSLALIIVLFFIIEKLRAKNSKIFISEKHLHLERQVGRSTFLWEEMANVILKDGMLTLDFKNNKIFQHLIAEDLSKDEEEIFNDFCKRQIAASSKH